MNVDILNFLIFVSLFYVGSMYADSGLYWLISLPL